METAVISKTWKFLSGSSLKVLAMASMLTDHLALFLWKGEPWCQSVLFSLGHRDITVYVLLRMFGRIAFPLFAFLLVEGFLHTRNRQRYGMRLLLLAVISEVPWNLIWGGGLLYPTQNVVFTLLLGYLGLCALERYEGDSRSLLACLLGLLIVSAFLRADYGCSGYGFILLLYVLRTRPVVRAVIGSCVLGSRWVAGLAFIPIALYNGRRGFVKGRLFGYVFYLFYPLHLLILYLIRS